MSFHCAAFSRTAFKIWPFLKLFLYISQNSMLRFPQMRLCWFCYKKTEKKNAWRCRTVKRCEMWTVLTPAVNKILMIFVKLGRIRTMMQDFDGILDCEHLYAFSSTWNHTRLDSTLLEKICSDAAKNFFPLNVKVSKLLYWKSESCQID